MKTLVLGASGQLGQCLKAIASERNINTIDFPDERVGNILDLEGLRALFQEKQPDFIINCAAYTAVDKAEDEVELCRNINRVGAYNVATVCKEHDVTMIQISTDFVFKGSVIELLREEDVAEPVNVYGLTKLESEEAIIKLLTNYYIIRTSWLYSEYASNFVKTMLKLGAERDELSIIADQIGSPTYAIDLAGVILDIVASERDEFGIYHYSNEGAISWFDFARGIFDISGTTVKVSPISTSSYPTKARRPQFSVMDKTKIKEVFGIAVPYWRDSLKQCIDKISSTTGV